jgi:DNA topoisomerase VI subunit B
MDEIKELLASIEKSLEAAGTHGVDPEIMVELQAIQLQMRMEITRFD